MKTIAISEAALAVLSECATVPFESVAFQSVVSITDGQLERSLYQEVNRVLEEIGGKWNRKAGGHIFRTSVEETAELLDGVIRSGTIAPLSKNGFFPTPLQVATEMFDLLAWKPEHKILEPSCGDGGLIKHFFDLFPNTGVPANWLGIETNGDLATRAVRNVPDPVDILNTDFMDDEWLQHLTEQEKFDRIIMNPPFEKRADAKHVLRAFELLKPGGRLVSVMAASVMFRREHEYQLVRDIATYFQELPAGSFKESGTMVNTVLVVIERAE